MNRFAFVTGVDHRERLAAYLPANYKVLGEGSRDGRSFFVIGGEDSAGWTLDGFVLPRLASGLIFGEEVDEAAARAVVASSARPDAYIGLPADSTARNLEHVTSLPHEVPCPSCRGTGGGTYNDCSYCDGNGTVVGRARRPRPDFDMHVDYPERFSDGPY